MKDFQQTQRAFSRHIKDPKNQSFDCGIEARRMQIYRDLFFNNICGFLETAFPVLKSLYAEARWLTLCRQFFAEHDCSSPYFVDISKEFVEYLSNEYHGKNDDPVFMQELAHYEWLELDVSVRRSDERQRFWNGEEDYQYIEVSDSATLASYHFPVHQISPGFQPEGPTEPIYVVVYRNENDEVNFSLVTAASAYMLNTIQQHEGMQVSQLCGLMTEAMPHITQEQVIEGAKQSVQEMLQQQVLVLTS